MCGPRGRAYGAGDERSAARARASRRVRGPPEDPTRYCGYIELKLRRALTDKPMFAFRKDPVAISMVE